MQFSIVAVLSALWKHRRLIIVITAIAGILGVLKVLISPREYEAQKLLVVTSIDLAPQPADAGSLSLNASIQAPLSPKVYADMLTYPNLLGEVYDKLLASNTITKKDYPRLADFSSKMSAGVTVVDQTARPVLYSPIITLAVTGDDPERIASIVKAWADAGTDWSREIGKVRTAAAAEQFVKERERSAADLETLQNALAEEKGKWNVEILKKELEERQMLMGEVEKALAEAERDLTGGEETLQALREAKAQEPEKIELYRSPSDDAYFIAKAAGGEKAAADAEKKGMIDEQFNLTLIEMEKLETETLGVVSAARGKLDTAKRQLDELRAKQTEQGTLLAIHEQTQDRLSANVKAGLDAYSQLAAAERVLDAVHSFATATNEKGVTPLGLNQLEKKVTPVVSRGLMGQGRKLYLMLIVAMAFVVSSLYAVFVEIVQPALRQAAR
ncbi:MAG: hypothetical protein HUU46_09550 [Candidatus Hydrogenedentes bacterium]|nr:hypothetical protein [Candidatus Hydrogenedentota bacterium]